MFMAACFALLMCFSQWAEAQYRPKRPPARSRSGETTQGWIGIKVGANFSAPRAGNAFDVFSFTTEPFADNAETRYEQYKTAGYQFGFTAGFEFLPYLSANIEPVFINYRYSYAVNYYWASVEDQTKNVSINYEHQNQLQYIEVPFTLKFELLHNKVKPYLQGGIYWGILLNATKDVTESLTDNASGNAIFETHHYAGNVKTLYESSQWGVVAGAGCTYNVGNARVGLQLNYKIGMKNIANAGTRFEDSQFVSGTFDAHDDLTLDNIALSMIVIMPLKFITSKEYVPM